MGITITSNVDASNFAKKAFSSVQNGLKLMCFLDTTMQKAMNDFSVESNAQLIGNSGIVVSGTGVKLNAISSTITTDLIEPDLFSVFIIAKPHAKAEAIGNDNKCSALAGNYEVSKGMALGYQMSTNGLLAFGRRFLDTSTNQHKLVAIASNEAGSYKTGDWGLHFVSFDGKKLYYNCLTSGFTKELVITANQVPAKSNVPLMIGGFPSKNTYKGDCDISQLRFYDRALSEEEMLKVVDEMRRYELSHNNRVV